MQFKAMLSAIVASTITSTSAAPVAEPAADVVARGTATCLPGGQICYDPFNQPWYIGDKANHGYGVRYDPSGTVTFNYGDSQLGYHPDGTIFYKDTFGQNCDVTAGYKGLGCLQLEYLLQGGNTLPGCTYQCSRFGINCQ